MVNKTVEYCNVSVVVKEVKNKIIYQQQLHNNKYLLCNCLGIIKNRNGKLNMSINKDKGIKAFHENCFACGKNSQIGLKLSFKLLENKTLFGTFTMRDDYKGYDDILHGGIISTILDSSMVNLFHLKNGLELKTAKLNLRFIKSIPLTGTMNIYAVADDDFRHFYKAKSKIVINGEVFAEAEGYFRK